MSLKKNQLFIESRIKHYSKRLSKSLSISPIDIRIYFLIRPETEWAYADSDFNMIVFNKHFLYKKVSPMYDWIIGHEVCHLYTDYQLRFKKSFETHGPAWKNNMILLGLPPVSYANRGYENLKNKLIYKEKEVCFKPKSFLKYKRINTKILKFDI